MRASARACRTGSPQVADSGDRSSTDTGVCDVGALFSSLAPSLERIVGSGVRAPRPLIEDACQVAWFRLWHYRHRVKREHALAWLVTTAIHEAYALLRRESRCLSLERALEESSGLPLARRALPDLGEIFQGHHPFEDVYVVLAASRSSPKRPGPLLLFLHPLSAFTWSR